MSFLNVTIGIYKTKSHLSPASSAIFRHKMKLYQHALRQFVQNARIDSGELVHEQKYVEEDACENNEHSEYRPTDFHLDPFPVVFLIRASTQWHPLVPLAFLVRPRQVGRAILAARLGVCVGCRRRRKCFDVRAEPGERLRFQLGQAPCEVAQERRIDVNSRALVIRRDLRA